MSRPWMPLYIADYLADTAHLNAAQSGAYLHLIMHYWQTGGLPNDDQALARIARMTSPEWRKSRALIAAFFGDGWRHKRIDAELQRTSEVSEAYAARARQAANKRWSKHATSSAPSTPQALHEQCVGMPISQPQRKERAEANASDGADAPPAKPPPRDIRAELFGDGLRTLARITGKTPDSCRSLVGKWLKSVQDEAIHVLGAIQDAERNNVADPAAWINRALQDRGTNANYRDSGHKSGGQGFAAFALRRALDG